MMKISIVTIVDPIPNYGNRLQNYAVQQVFCTLGMDVQTISFEKDVLTINCKIKYLLQRIMRYRLPGNVAYWKYEVPRRIIFNKFNHCYINILRINKLDDVIKYPVDFYVIGSDQVWNPLWYDNISLKKDIYLLTFTNAEKKICFSPSFGIEDFPEKWKSWFKKYLSDIPMLSVREEAGAKIIRDLTGKTAEILIDPTMMLDASEWLKIAQKPKNVDFSKPYILAYFLGGRSEQVNYDLEQYAKENELGVYNLLDFGQPDIYVSGPSEFVYLIANSRLILTDSFHACVFAFLFKKPFLVYQRQGNNKMMSRMDTFLKKFDLERKYVDSGLPNRVFECDYTFGYRQLEVERKKVINFLKKSMHIL